MECECFRSTFLVACSLADLVRRFRQEKRNSRGLADKVAIQINDTHPALAVPELMRILLDDAHLGWDEAWEITQKTLAYTNHTLLPEALEKWPLEWFDKMFPRDLEIILEINRRLICTVRSRFPGDEKKIERISLVEEGSGRNIRMANLAIVGSHSTNGVAAIHSELLRSMTVKELAESFQSVSITRPTVSRLDAGCCSRILRLAHTISEAIGDAWITDLDQLITSSH